MLILPERLSTLWYALQTGTDEEQDENGYFTGRKIPLYSDPVEAHMIVSPEEGSSRLADTGIQKEAVRHIITNDMNTPLSETSILWIDKQPYDEGGSLLPHNYVVDSVKRSLFAVGITAKKVVVSAPALGILNEENHTNPADP